MWENKSDVCSCLTFVMQVVISNKLQPVLLILCFYKESVLVTSYQSFSSWSYSTSCRLPSCWFRPGDICHFCNVGLQTKLSSSHYLFPDKGLVFRIDIESNINVNSFNWHLKACFHRLSLRWHCVLLCVSFSFHRFITLSLQRCCRNELNLIQGLILHSPFWCSYWKEDWCRKKRKWL